MTTDERSTPGRIQLLAFALWAKEKCTTEYGIDITVWESMDPCAKREWMKRGEYELRRGVKEKA